MATLGDFDAAAVIYGKFTTYRPSTGASYTLGGTPALSVYKDNSTTQSTTGVTLTADFDSVTGLNHFAIDTSADGSFYAAGSFFDIVITTGTVDSVSVTGSVVASFTLRKTSSLKPTTAARTLDVSTGGEAGVDWANVGSPTTTVGLSGTTVKTATDVETDTADIQTRLPAALVSGRIDASVGAMASGVLTATAIAADAITAAKVADGTIDAATFAAGAINAAAIASDAITAAKVADGAIDAATFAAGAINAAAIASDAITDAKVASDVTIASVTGAVGSVTGAVGSVTGAVGSVTGDVGGNVTGSVGSVTGLTAADVGAIKLVTDKLEGMTEVGTGSPTYYRWEATSLEQAPTGGSAPSAATIADAVWDEARAGHVAGGSFGEGVASVTGAVASVTGNVGGNVTGSVGSVAAGGITASSFAANAINAAKLDPDVTTELQSGLATAAALATVDGIVDDILLDTAEIGAAGAGLTNINLPNQTMDIVGNITGNLSGSVGSVTGAVGSVTGAVASVTGAVGSVTGAVGSVTGNVGGNVTGSVGSVTGLTASDVGVIKSVTDKLDGMTELGSGSPTYYRFETTALEQAPTGGSAPSAATIADAVWDEARSGHVAGGSFGEGVASVTGSVASVTGLTASDVGAIKTKTDNLPSDPADASDVAALITAVDDFVDTEVAAIKTVVDAVKVKTDSLTFTVAGQVDSNIQYVNDTQIQGTGAVGSDEWRKV